MNRIPLIDTHDQALGPTPTGKAVVDHIWPVVLAAANRTCSPSSVFAEATPTFTLCG